MVMHGIYGKAQLNNRANKWEAWWLWRSVRQSIYPTANHGPPTCSGTEASAPPSPMVKTALLVSPKSPTMEKNTRQWNGMEAKVALIVAFRSSALLGLVSLIFLLTVRFRSGKFCWPIKHSNTMVIEPAFGTFGSVGRCQVLLENEISISIKLVSRRKHEVLQNFLVDGCVDCGLQKHTGPTPADDVAAQIITDCGHFTLDFKQHGFCASPLFLQTQGLWTTEQQSSSFSP